MKNQIKNYHPLLLEVNNILVDLPGPSSISYIWNWGSMLGVVLILQLVSGLILASHFNSGVDFAFRSIVHIIKDVNYGWILRILHMNGASFFFIIVYIHIARGILFSSFKSLYVWSSGTIILFLLIGTAFIGYVLPWGQISFWGATVITNLVSAVPYIGVIIVEWLWGGFSVGGATLSRFFMLHFLLPFILIALIIIHLLSLHIFGSNNPLGINSNFDKISFHNYFSFKDLLRIIIFFIVLFLVSLIYPYRIGDPENFNPANPLSTPIHIQPEWYFLFAYAILRSIPNKLGGVIALILSILIIIILPFKNKNFISSKFNPFQKIFFWFYSSFFVILTWIGANPVEYPFESIGQVSRFIYFLLLILI